MMERFVNIIREAKSRETCLRGKEHDGYDMLIRWSEGLLPEEESQIVTRHVEKLTSMMQIS